MSNHPTQINPSQAVERIREIIVGRHLERLEARIERLETPHWQGPPGSANEDRMIAAEARLEAMQDNIQRFADLTRDELERRSFLQREEVQRLAVQIQQVAATRAAEASGPAVQHLEQKLGAWLNSWQLAFHAHSSEREKHVVSHMQRELGALREWIDARFADLDRRYPDRLAVDERFNRLAAAARAFAESASPFQAQTGGPVR